MTAVAVYGAVARPTPRDVGPLVQAASMTNHEPRWNAGRASGKRRKIHPATEAALWALSNGQCYFPSCTAPVVVETRPGVYRKNAWVSHIYGVRPEAARHDDRLPDSERDAFKHLLLLCYPHHTEVDDRETAGNLYPPHELHKWKEQHEGRDGPVLAALGQVSEEELTDMLTEVFTPPLERLEAITERLERTGEANAETVEELRRVIKTMSERGGLVDPGTASIMSFAAEVFGNSDFRDSASHLAHASDVLPRVVQNLSNVVSQLPEY